MLNRVCLIGRLVRDPEKRTTNTGKTVVEFTLAIAKRVTPVDPNQPDADFIRVKAWNQTANYLSEYAAKGRLVSVDGRLEQRRFVDKDNQQREAIEIVADNVSLLDQRKDAEAQAQHQVAGQPNSDGDVPRRGGGRASSSDFDPFE